MYPEKTKDTFIGPFLLGCTVGTLLAVLLMMAVMKFVPEAEWMPIMGLGVGFLSSMYFGHKFVEWNNTIRERKQ